LESSRVALPLDQSGLSVYSVDTERVQRSNVGGHERKRAITNPDPRTVVPAVSDGGQRVRSRERSSVDKRAYHTVAYSQMPGGGDRLDDVTMSSSHDSSSYRPLHTSIHPSPGSTDSGVEFLRSRDHGPVSSVGQRESTSSVQTRVKDGVVGQTGRSSRGNPSRKREPRGAYEQDDGWSFEQDCELDRNRTEQSHSGRTWFDESGSHEHTRGKHNAQTHSTPRGVPSGPRRNDSDITNQSKDSGVSGGWRESKELSINEGATTSEPQDIPAARNIGRRHRRRGK